MLYMQMSLISGFMLGIEFIFDENLVVLDIGIIRILIGKEDGTYE